MVFMCVRKTRILSVILSVCTCVRMSELKREDSVVLTYMCVYACIRMSFSANIPNRRVYQWVIWRKSIVS